MNRSLLTNIFLNIVLAVLFVVVSNEALKAGLEETLVTVVMIYGVVSVGVNAVLVKKYYNNPK
jgi:hypothetical protein